MGTSMLLLAMLAALLLVNLAFAADMHVVTLIPDDSKYPASASSDLNTFAQAATTDLRAASGGSDTFKSLTYTYRSEGGSTGVPTLTARVDAVLDATTEPAVDTVLAIVVHGEADLIESVVVRATEKNIPVISLARLVLEEVLRERGVDRRGRGRE